MEDVFKAIVADFRSIKMAVTVKSAREIELMREAGKILAEVHDELGRVCETGYFYSGDRSAWRKADPEAMVVSRIS